MQAYIDLLARGKVKLTNLYSSPYKIENAHDAYEALKVEGQKPLMVFLEYPEREGIFVSRVTLHRSELKSDKIRVALVGASSFAQGVHLPNMVKLRDQFILKAVMSRTGANARAVATQYQSAYCTTDYEDVLQDREIDLVMIATRHHLHGSMVLQALQAGKHVFVEKPLATKEDEIRNIQLFYSRNEQLPMLMVGFNRRFSPAIQNIRKIISHRTTPIIVNYRMNAGYLPLDHWVHGTEGGGRNIGEACHIYDLFNYLVDGSKANKVNANSIKPKSKQWGLNDNFVATITYADGSLCTLTYTALGDKSYPKERMEIFVDGKVIVLDDYKSVTVHGGRQKGWYSNSIQKGQLEELEALALNLKKENSWPISFEDQIQASWISFEVERQLVG
jgi:predicted dehydrogenase